MDFKFRSYYFFMYYQKMWGAANSTTIKNLHEYAKDHPNIYIYIYIIRNDF